MSVFDKVAVIGAGAWGTALANTSVRAGREVVLVARDEAAARALACRRESPHLPGIALSSEVTVTHEAAAARDGIVLMVVPAQAVREAATELAPHLHAGAPLVVCAKGIERGTQKFMTEVIAQVVPQATPAILSGPSFAADVARGLPTAVTLAAGDDAMAAALSRALGCTTFRPYHTTDVRGVEIGGAAKNVLAIAAGIVAGRKLGASALAALTTRGFAELVRFGRAHGAQAETLAGLSGLGDLILTCASPQSRNFALGQALAEGHREAAAGKLSEGLYTAAVLAEMAAARAIDMPIARAVADILAGRLTVDAAIDALLTRPFRAEG
ncbi:MAG: NAD(P)-dependent glycerol-3-phosphate dehydrogenase [Xanthobacteraceae bacterium]|nr:MAG: NAD(P)-dependent glycerol-3-phosphate dehydrogenase [Xanthobacteraceae bacterium]